MLYFTYAEPVIEIYNLLGTKTSFVVSVPNVISDKEAL